MTAAAETPRKGAEKKQGGRFALAFWSFTLGFVLALALAAAAFVVVSNAPIPFVNRIQSAQTTTEPSLVNGKPMDPNQKLYASGQGVEQQIAVAAPTEGANAPAAGSKFLVTAARYQKKADAENMVSRIVFIGLEAKITQTGNAATRLWSVELGPYDTDAQAQEIRQLLASNGINATVTH